jgi:hypothetical protein
VGKRRREGGKTKKGIKAEAGQEAGYVSWRNVSQSVAAHRCDHATLSPVSAPIHSFILPPPRLSRPFSPKPRTLVFPGLSTDMLLHVGPAPWATPADVRGLYVKGMITGPLTSPAWTVVPASKKPKPNAAAAVLLTLWLLLLVMVPVISTPSHGSIESAASRAAIYGCRCQYAGRKSTNTLSLPRQWKGRFEDIRQRPWRKGPGGEKYSLVFMRTICGTI